MGAVPADCYRINLRWNMEVTEGVPAEVGMVTFHGQRHHIATNPIDEADSCQRIADKVHDAAVANLKPLNYWSSAFRADRVDVYHLVASTGRADEKKSATFEDTDRTWGAATNSLPWESSIVCGLYAYPVGYVGADKNRRRGRIFLPPFASGPLATDGSGELNPAVLNSFLGPALISFFNAIQGAPIGDTLTGVGTGDWINLGVLSRTAVSFAQLEFLNIGSKFHHQRRRELQQPASSFGNVITHS
jgi:hypothetical protein